jgi:DNA-directed RNA polymerase specialized sigma24 family protein
MKVDETAALAEVLRDYQEHGANDHIEARLAIALTRVVENTVRPSLMKKLRPQDVDDICSEIILGFWQFRLSVRPDEVGKLIQTLKQRRSTDQVRQYYREEDRRAQEPGADERQLLALLPARDGKPGTEAGQDVWERLYDLKLSAQDHLVAYTVYLGIDKQVIGKLLGMSSSAVTRSLKRCREALAGVSNGEDTKERNA